jgi:hypothetical protein
MTRRQSECFRNLDDPLKIFSLLTVKSCGLVFLFYGATIASELVFGVWTLLFGGWSFLAQLGAAMVLAALLFYAERNDDEHLVPSALRYYASRRWRVVYAGAGRDQYRGNPISRVVKGGPWAA